MFFDNLVVQHYTGPLTEENVYYPFGLKMAGISSNAAGRLENKKKYNGYEENKTFDLNWYETFYRTHDPQLGRFWQTDPKPTDFESLYAAMGNNPISHMDILGDTVGPGDGKPTSVLGGIWRGIKKVAKAIVDPDTYVENKTEGDARFKQRAEEIGTGYAILECFGIEKINYAEKKKQAEEFAKLSPGEKAEQLTVDIGSIVVPVAIAKLRVGGPKVKSKAGATVAAVEAAEATSSAVAKYWPENGGAMGQWTNRMAQVGEVMDRYGPTAGRYASPTGTPINMRSLAFRPYPGDYFRFQVLKPFMLEMSKVAPAFDSPGLGIQYRMPVGINYLQQFGYIKIL
jgi:RHS repeat-associated protein